MRAVVIQVPSSGRGGRRGLDSESKGRRLAADGRWPVWSSLRRVRALTAYWWYQRDQRSSSQENVAQRERSEGEIPAIRVKVIHAQRGGITRTTTQPGVIHYFEHADLYAKASGYLRAQVVDIGDTVKRGQVLAEVYDPERRQRVEEAAARVMEARAEVTQAEAMVKVAQADITTATSEVKERKAEVARYAALRKYHQKQYVGYVQLAVSRDRRARRR